MSYINKVARAVRKLLRDLEIDAAFVGVLWLARIWWAKFRTPMEGLSMQWAKTAQIHLRRQRATIQ
jgi:hypothetical protein